MSLAINSTIFNGKYTILEQLGEGRYGHIFKIVLTKSINDTEPIYYALKAIDMVDIKKNSTLKENLNREIRIHENLDHPNIVNMIDYGYTDKNDYKLIILEYIDFGDMWDLLYDATDDSQHYLTEDEACNYFHQLLQALIYLRNFGIIHRDLKPENILITKSGTIKLADFGWAIDRPSSQYVGTTKYCSPEMIASHAKYNYKTDIWSAGIILYELLYGTVPFDSNKETKIEYKIQNKNITFPNTPMVSQSAKNLIVSMLNRNPHKRPDYEKILAHEWFDNLLIDNSSVEDFIDIEFDQELNKEIEDELELLRSSLYPAPLKVETPVPKPVEVVTPVPTTPMKDETPRQVEKFSPKLEYQKQINFTPLDVIVSEQDWSDNSEWSD